MTSKLNSKFYQHANYQLGRLRKYYRRKLQPSVITLNGARIPAALFPDDLRQHIYQEHYENAEFKIVRRHLSSSDVVVEMGGGAGYITTLMTKICGSRNVVVFEPNPESLKIMKETFRLNQVTPCIVERAVCATGGNVELNACVNFWSSSTRTRKGVTQVLQVEATSLTDVLSLYQPTFLMIDIEGGEADLVGEIISPCVEKVVIEMHEHVIGREAVSDVRKWINQNGFDVVVDGGGKGVSLWVRRQGAR